MNENISHFLKKNYLKKVKIFCPKNRIDNYIIYCQKIFCFKNIEFIKNLENLNSDELLILDQSLLDVLLKKEKKYKDKNIKLIVLFWNGDLDYFYYKNKIIKLKKKFKLYGFTLSNFYKFKNIYALNNFKIQEKIKNVNISGVGLLKKIKYKFPLIFSIYNSITNFQIFKKMVFSKKIVFVGTTSLNKDLLSRIKIYKFDNKVLKDINRFYLVKNFSTLHNSYEELNFLKKLSKSNYFKKQQFHKKFWLINLILRSIYFNHLSKFYCVYIKNQRSNSFDILRSRILKKIFIIDVGSNCGNSHISARALYCSLNYKYRTIKANFFSHKKNYNKMNIFYNEINLIEKKLKKFLDFQKFNCQQIELIKFISKNSLY